MNPSDGTSNRWFKGDIIEIKISNIHDDLIYTYQERYYDVYLKSDSFFQNCSNPNWKLSSTTIDITTNSDFVLPKDEDTLPALCNKRGC